MMKKAVRGKLLQHPKKRLKTPNLFTSEGSQTNIPDELPIDSSWEDIYESALAPGTNNPETVEFESQRSNASTLLDHLLWQLELTPFSERDHAIAMAIIDSINEDGYLSSTPEDIYQGLQSQFDDLDFDEVIAVLHRVQQFDPAGVAAIDLSDCLRLQLLQLPETTPYREEALIVVTRLSEAVGHSRASKAHTQTGRYGAAVG